MADTTNVEVFGMDTFKMGPVGAAGTMGETLTTYTGVKDGTMTFAMDKPTKSDVNIYESDSPYAVILSGTTRSISLEIMGLKLSQLPAFLGGTFTAGVAATTVAPIEPATNDTWTEPAILPVIIQSIFAGSKDKAGKPLGFNFLRCQVTGGQSFSPSKTDGFGVQLELQILTPFDTEGNALGAREIIGDLFVA